jgi:RHS repeat-associated protein
VARTEYDDLGRTTRTIENYVDGVVGDDNDKTTEYTYGPAGMTSLTAKLTGGGGQTTEWVYGVGSGSGIVSNDIVGATRWPDPSTGASSSSEQETVLVNALGQPLVTTDRNGNTHTLTYDILGRVTADAVTTLGSGVDGSVRRVETAYDSQGQAYLFTTFDAANGGNIVTQVQRQFNGLGQLTSEWQSHSGAVTSSTPRVQYAYSAMSGGANHSRLTSLTHPSGYVLTYNYSSGLNGSISRLSSLSDSTGTIESYDYLGLGTVVRRSHPQPNLDLTFPGSGGDQYVGLDRFGRVVDQNWSKAGTSTDRFTYSYDRNGNRLTKGNALNSAFSETYSYDGLNQLSSFARGNGDSQSWNFDSLGNWDSVTTNGTTQTRSANAQNEITSISGATTPTYDANGNMTTDETGKQFVYDAWNRLKVVKDSGGTTLKTYQYDAMNRRVAEVVGGDTTDLYYSSQWQVLEERVNGNGKYRYVWSPVYVDAMMLRDRLDVSERLWVQQDANFNVTAIVNDSGNVVERYAYEPYGKVTVVNASWSELSGSTYYWQYLHQGGRLDLVDGLYSFRNRDYSPVLGRWVSMDPIQYLSKDRNLYRYVDSNPLMYLDPIGYGPIEFLQRKVRELYDDVKARVDPVSYEFKLPKRTFRVPLFGHEFEYEFKIKLTGRVTSKCCIEIIPEAEVGSSIPAFNLLRGLVKVDIKPFAIVSGQIKLCDKRQSPSDIEFGGLYANGDIRVGGGVELKPKAGIDAIETRWGKIQAYAHGSIKAGATYKIIAGEIKFFASGDIGISLEVPTPWGIVVKKYQIGVSAGAAPE